MNIRLALIYGSTREGRFCDTVAAWVRSELEYRPEFSVDVIDPAVPGPSLRERIAAAEAYIVVTPEYNHSYPAALKLLIDSFSHEWHAKPVAFVSYGGISGGLRAVEHLRNVFAELHVTTVRDTVSFSQAWTQFDEAGNLREPERPRRSLNVLLARLTWWAKALRNARTEAPYSEAVAR